MWACGNPFAEKGKELCDVLVVCDPHVIIISVKDIVLNEAKELAGFQRWERKAIDASVDQIYGAEKKLLSLSKVTFNDGSHGLTLPEPGQRMIHRIAVAFGSEGKVPIKSGDFGKGFVHVMHEESFFRLLDELDTISDLTQYFAAKEEFSSRCSIVIEGSEANLLGFYLLNNRSFPAGSDIAVIDDTVWAHLERLPEWKRRKDANQSSYAWDRLIDLLADPKSKSINGPQPELDDLEYVLRSMARESRFFRRVLGEAVQTFLTQAMARKLRSRIIQSPSGIIYVLVYFFPEDPYEHRTPELALRCVAARKKVGEGQIVIGVGIGQHESGQGSTSDVVYLNPPDWKEFIAGAENAMKSAKYFTQAEMQKKHFDEYPPG